MSSRRLREFARSASPPLLQGLTTPNDQRDRAIRRGCTPLFEQANLELLSLRLQRAAGALDKPYRPDKPFGPALDHSTSNARTKKGRP